MHTPHSAPRKDPQANFVSEQKPFLLHFPPLWVSDAKFLIRAVLSLGPWT